MTQVAVLPQGVTSDASPLAHRNNATGGLLLSALFYKAEESDSRSQAAIGVLQNIMRGNSCGAITATRRINRLLDMRRIVLPRLAFKKHATYPRWTFYEWRDWLNVQILNREDMNETMDVLKTEVFVHEK